MTSIQIFSSFCSFIDAQIFSEDNAGMSVSFVVDKAFIMEFCEKNNITENTLMDAVRVKMYSSSRDIEHIKGVLAIQLYAASKRTNSDGITVKNYRDRLSQVLDWDTNNLQGGWKSIKSSIGNHSMNGVIQIIFLSPSVRGKLVQVDMFNIH